MSKKLYEESNIQSIADAIRTKTGTQDTYKISQMPGAILGINPEPDDVSGGGGGTASFDNIIVGSSVPDASIGTPGDAYIQVLTNRVDGHAYNIIKTVFYKTLQNVWAAIPDPALPYPRISIRIVTHSFSGDDASIDFYIDQSLIRNILYTTVKGASAHNFDDLFNLFVGYQTSKTPDHVNRSGWCIYSPSNKNAIYNGEIINSDSLIQTWAFNNSVDFTVEV